LAVAHESSRPNLALDREGSRLGVLVLPEPEDQPVGLGEDPVRVLVPSDIGLELVFPLSSVHTGAGRMIGASVPEAAVDEHGDPFPRKEKVGSASTEHGEGVVDSVPKAESMNMTSDSHLTGGVSASRALHPEAHFRRAGRGLHIVLGCHLALRFLLFGPGVQSGMCLAQLACTYP